MIANLVSALVGGAISLLIARSYYGRQARDARFAEVSAQSRHDDLKAEVLKVGARLDPERLVEAAYEPVTTSGGEEIVTSNGETIVVLDYNALADAFERCNAPRMAEIVRRAAAD